MQSRAPCVQDESDRVGSDHQFENHTAMPIDSVAILPWLTLNEPVEVGEVTYYPARSVDAVLGEKAAILKDRLHIYCDTWDSKPIHATFALHRRQLDRGGPAPTAEIREATDIFLVASIFQNDGGFGNEVNATTFTLFFQGLGGQPGFLATRVRRRYGGFVTGFTTEQQVIRPAYAASLIDYSRELIDALVAAQNHPDAWKLFTALEWFRRGSTEADNTDHDVDLVLLLTAIDFLLAHPGTSRRGGLDQDRILALLSRFELRPCCSVRRTKVERSYIQTFLFVLDRVRNETIHPEADAEKAEHYSFGRSNVAFAWFADRCFMALLVARLIEVGVLQETDDLRAFVTGIEEWLFEPKDSLGKIMLDVKLKQAVRNYLSVLREHEIAEIGLAEAVDDSRKQWERDFFAAVEPAPAPFKLELHWTDGRARVDVLRSTSGKGELLDEMVVDPEVDEPTRIAWAAKSYFSRNSMQEEARELTDSDVRAMQDPRIFLGGTRSD